MTGPTPPRMRLGGGAPIALLTIAGPIIFGLLGYSPSLGVVVGLGLGILVALVVWLIVPR